MRRSDTAEWRFLVVLMVVLYHEHVAAFVPQKKAALVFLHGLGNSPRTCAPMIQDRLLQLDPSLAENMEFVFPAAPRLCNTVNGGQCLPCWFDLYDWPVGLSVRDDRKGIRQAVQQVELEVNKLQAQGIPKDRIVVAGFSQGATLALETVYGNHHCRHQDDDHYAGCIALSGWLALRDTLHCSSEACQSPLFWGHGQFDENVRPEQQFFGVKKLMQQGVRSTTTKSYEMGHGICHKELCDIVDFLHRVLLNAKDTTTSPLQKQQNKNEEEETLLAS